MINILMPMAGKSIFFESSEYKYPKPLIEIQGKTMIERAIENYQTLKQPHRFLFVVNSSDCLKFHIDNVLHLLTDHTCGIIRLEKETKGAACSCLLAIDAINNKDPLIIANTDQIIDHDINMIIKSFIQRELDAGVVCFSMVHPRWSYVRLDADEKIIEAAEKRPISNLAIAGFYYFREGRTFVRAAMKSIERDAGIDGVYYIAPIFNELVLQNMNLGIFKIDNQSYHTFYSPQMIKEFEQRK